MLQLTDDGVKIVLTGQPTATGGGLFWFGLALLIGAIGVAMAMSVLPERFAIGALALLIVGSFIFNISRQKQKKKQSAVIDSGVVWVRAGEFIHEAQGKKTHARLAAGDRITTGEQTLSISDASGNRRYQLAGFESAKEPQVMQAILEGQNLNKRHANIKMQSTP